MRISLFIPDFREGGAQKMMINLANELAKKSLGVDLVVACNTGSFDKLVDNEVNIIRLNCKRTLTSLFLLIKYIKSAKTDILISALYHANVICLFAKYMTKRTNTKFIVTERNYLSLRIANSTNVKDKILLPIIKRLYPKADLVIAISKGVMNDIVDICNLDSEKISCIYNPVVTSDFEESIKATPEINFNKDLPLIIASGRLVEQKDYPTMLKALALVIKQKPVNAMVLGKGHLEKELITLSQELGIDNNVIFKGFVDNPLSYMKQADIFLMTSAWEGFGNVLVEALYCGLSVVATDCKAGPAEILDDGKYGLLVPVGNEIAISDAILKVIDKPFDKDKQQKRALEFTARNITDKYLEHIKDIISK